MAIRRARSPQADGSPSRTRRRVGQNPDDKYINMLKEILKHFQPGTPEFDERLKILSFHILADSNDDEELVKILDNLLSREKNKDVLSRLMFLLAQAYGTAFDQRLLVIGKIPISRIQKSSLSIMYQDLHVFLDESIPTFKRQGIPSNIRQIIQKISSHDFEEWKSCLMSDLSKSFADFQQRKKYIERIPDQDYRQDAFQELEKSKMVRQQNYKKILRDYVQNTIPVSVFSTKYTKIPKQTVRSFIISKGVEIHRSPKDSDPLLRTLKTMRKIFTQKRRRQAKQEQTRRKLEQTQQEGSLTQSITPKKILNAFLQKVPISSFLSQKVDFGSGGNIVIAFKSLTSTKYKFFGIFLSSIEAFYICQDINMRSFLLEKDTRNTLIRLTPMTTAPIYVRRDDFLPLVKDQKCNLIYISETPESCLIISKAAVIADNVISSNHCREGVDRVNISNIDDARRIGKGLVLESGPKKFSFKGLEKRPIQQYPLPVLL